MENLGTYFFRQFQLGFFKDVIELVYPLSLSSLQPRVIKSKKNIDIKGQK